MTVIKKYTLESLASPDITIPDNWVERSTQCIFSASLDGSSADVAIIGRISSRGPATEPDSPMIELRQVNDNMTQSIRKDLLEALLQYARKHHINRLLITNDPMDAAGISILTSLGFKPAGRGPYRTLSSDTVEYITGYADATGSELDFVWTAA